MALWKSPIVQRTNVPIVTEHHPWRSRRVLRETTGPIDYLLNRALRVTLKERLVQIPLYLWYGEECRTTQTTPSSCSTIATAVTIGTRLQISWPPIHFHLYLSLSVSLKQRHQFFRGALTTTESGPTIHILESISLLICASISAPVPSLIISSTVSCIKSSTFIFGISTPVSPPTPPLRFPPSNIVR